MENLSENLFQAIDTIIAARINSLPYDFTKQCKVINIDEADKGIYRVNDGSAFFVKVFCIIQCLSGIEFYIRTPKIHCLNKRDAFLISECIPKITHQCLL